MTSYAADQKLGRTLLGRATRDAIGFAAGSFAAAAHALHAARAGFAPFEITRELAYGPAHENAFDVWRLRDGARGRRPVVLFFHGGGFQQLDKQSHWGFAERFARMGAVVFNADYRLAPRHPYPAAAEDAELAYDHALRLAPELGGDVEQLILAGTSAGANLALGLAITRGARAAVLHSGLLQVSDMPRLYRARARVPLAIRARMATIGVEYAPASAWELPALPDPRLDPLLVYERQANLPPCALFISSGSRDYVLEDSLRLRARLAQSDVPHELDVLPRGGHAFQGFIFQPAVRTIWARCERFLRAQGLHTHALTR